MGRSISITPTILNRYEITFADKGIEKTLAVKTDLPSAVYAAEGLVKKHFNDLTRLLSLHSRWRREPATQKQLNILRKIKIELPEGITKGQASHLIEMLSKT